MIVLRGITAESYPYHYNHDLYQEYYWDSLEALCRSRSLTFTEAPNVHFPWFFRNLRRVRHSYKLGEILRGPLLPAVLDAIAGVVSQGKTEAHVPPIGLYVFNFDDIGGAPVCIDSRDTHEISYEYASSCMIYFKTNFWPASNYPPHVVPLPNMNPLVGRNVDLFRKLRTARITRDLFAFVRVWGGTNQVDGIDHNIRLLYELSKVPCRSLIVAYLVSGDIASQKAKLDSLGIRWTTRPMAARELWRNASESRLNLVRMGMHQCTPWRLIDVLAMGRIPVFDYRPLSLWPAPLIEGSNFLNLDFGPGDEVPQRSFSETFSAWLSNARLLSNICSRNADYFDECLTFDGLGHSIVGQVESILLSSSITCGSTFSSTSSSRFSQAIKDKPDNSDYWETI